MRSRPKLKRGFVQIYTGTGKGKTTAVIGLAVRALGAGLRVCLIHFLKGQASNEHRILTKLPGLGMKKFGRKSFMKGKPALADYQEAQRGLKAVQQALFSGHYDLVIADELCVAGLLGLISEKNILGLMQNRPPQVELVLTGRGATVKMKHLADLVTEMREIKHYFSAGILARKGIEY